ncbi:helix-turn-helix transcriptional regulator [Kitasatospora sp. NPDC057904]|uniref:helix-turn-helix transcriptional regulator n=1 Tax=unclassified Kitasatospora TaxID=2633591 RepID=UPI0036D8CDF1
MYPSDSAIVWRNRTLRLLDHVPVPIAVCEYAGRILIVNRAMAAEFGLLTGQLHHRKILEFFTLQGSAAETLPALAEAVHKHRRSQYSVEVSWTAGDGSERHGIMDVALVSDTPDQTPNLLLSLRVLADLPAEPPPEVSETAVPRTEVSPTEARILAAAARGATTAQIAREIGLTRDGVNYHLTRLSRRWHVPNRTALVARAYAYGVLAPDAWPPEPA